MRTFRLNAKGRASPTSCVRSRTSRFDVSPGSSLGNATLCAMRARSAKAAWRFVPLARGRAPRSAREAAREAVTGTITGGCMGMCDGKCDGVATPAGGMANCAGMCEGKCSALSAMAMCSGQCSCHLRRHLRRRMQTRCDEQHQLRSHGQLQRRCSVAYKHRNAKLR